MTTLEQTRNRASTDHLRAHFVDNGCPTIVLSGEERGILARVPGRFGPEGIACETETARELWNAAGEAINHARLRELAEGDADALRDAEPDGTGRTPSLWANTGERTR